ncbi:hypothetical protein LguiA_011831 [Lonicera macranthoides]
MANLFFLLLCLSCAPHPLTSTPTTHIRRILHQPFFPQDSPPSPPPSPQPPTPKIPFSTSTPTPTNQPPFFPSYPSPPPPPSPTSLASFPANISSLTLPQSPKPKPTSSKLIATAVAVVLAAVVVVAIVVFLHIRKKRQHSYVDDNNNTNKTHTRSDYNSTRSVNVNLFNDAGAGSANAQHKHQRRPSQTSSEFLYLGTLVNSHTGIDPPVTAPSPFIRNSSDESPRKLDSPELRPLPPLSAGLRQNPAGDDEDDEFYSPRGSVGGRESSIDADSASRRAFAAVEAKNFEGISGSSSSSYSSSTSGSPARSVSLSISPPVSLSPISSRTKSPELAALPTAPPSNSSSPNNSYSSDSSKSSLRISNVSGRIQNPSSVSVSIPAPPPLPPPPPPVFAPPPPPPLPQRKHCEIPTTPTPTPLASKPVSHPPVLITPSRPVTLQTPAPISPLDLPSATLNAETNEETPKLKLKPLHWDKVRASSDRETVWDQLKSSSFKLNEEMIETLFVVNTPNSNSKEATRRSVLPSPSQENRVLDPKKSQNISILLRAINVTIEEVCEALLEGNADTLGTELLESLLKMAPTKEEERKLREYKDDSPVKLGPAERFLKALLDIPFAFKRMDAMLYVSNFDSEVEYLKKSCETLEAACEELRSSRMFLKLLEAVLKTGNRMNVGTNRGDAHAFKLDTLLKLVDVKGADGKTTLLHFVVQEIIRSEGARLSGSTENQENNAQDDAKCRKLGLQVISGISSELTNVKKAASMDSEVLNGDVLKLSKGLSNIAEVVRLNKERGSDENTRRFSESMNKFMKTAEEEIIRIQAQESVALSLVKEITEYFHGNSAKEEAHPFRIFMVVRDFLATLDRVCKEVGMINERTIVSSAHKFPVPVNPTLPPPVFNGFLVRRQCSSSSDEDSASP